MKIKKIVKRLRSRADELRQNAGSSPGALLVAEVLEEVADQLAPRRSKPSLKKMMEARKAAKKAKKVKALTPSTNNGVTHEPSGAHVKAGVGG